MTRPFGHGPSPEGWAATRLRAFLDRRRETGRSDLPLLSVNLPQGVVARQEGDGRPAPAEDLSAYQVVHKGDLVMNQLGKPHGALGVSPSEGIISPAYFVATVGPLAEPRFVHHLLRTRLYISEYERRGKFMPPSQFDISWDQFRSIEVLLPPMRIQRAIADYLDAETARIDSLVEKKRRMVHLLAQRLNTAVMSYIFREEVRYWPSLKRVADVLPGYAFSSDLFRSDENGGVRLLRGINVTPGRLRWDETVVIDPEQVVGLERYALQPGDVVVGMDRPLVSGGMRVAEVFDGDLPCMLVQRVARLRVHGANRHYVRLALWSDAFVEYFTPIVTGVSVPHISDGQIKSFRIPLPGQQAQDEIARSLLALEAQVRRGTDLLERQIALLTEHRQALITAAVTGDLPVARVAL